jgi:prevent-host-death family protein
MERVGLRELKMHLSRHLRRVQAGRRLVVTDRGRTIAAIEPVDDAAGSAPELEWARRMVMAGRLQWAGGKPRGTARRPALAAGSELSRAVIEDRR